MTRSGAASPVIPPTVNGLAPHFEKMLYDALLVIALSEAYQLTGKELYRETIEQTMEFIDRELSDPGKRRFLCGPGCR